MRIRRVRQLGVVPNDLIPGTVIRAVGHIEFPILPLLKDRVKLLPDILMQKTCHAAPKQHEHSHNTRKELPIKRKQEEIEKREERTIWVGMSKKFDIVRKFDRA